MYQQFKYLLSLCFVLLLWRCVEPVELDLQHDPKIVVLNQNFAASEPLEIILAETRPLFSEGNKYINNATVQITQDGKPIGELNHVPNSDGKYGTEGRLIPEEGLSYAITVDAPGLESIHASNTIPQKVPIKKIDILNLQKKEKENNQTEYNYQLDIVIDDPSNVNNYYQITFIQLLWDYSILGRDTILFPFPSLTRPAIIQRNISDPIIKHPETGALIKDDLFDGKEKKFQFDASIIFNESEKLIGQLVIELRTVSEDYYLFYSSLARQSQSTGSSNITAFDEPSSVYTNIENGYGIFAGYSFDLKAVSIK